MGFRVVENGGQVQVLLSGWDRIMCWRRSVLFDQDQIDSVALARRGDLEPAIDHRVLGVGTHDGGRRPGGRRVGVMVGRGVQGQQFWATSAGGPEAVLVVLELSDHKFRRAVLSVTDPGGFRSGAN
jgi:hypothetical protein